MTQKTMERLNFWITIATIVMGGVVYGLAGFTYAHSTFITKEEANARRDGRDREINLILQSVQRIEGKLDNVIDKRSK